MNLESWVARAKANQKKYKHFLESADKNKILPQLPSLHEEAFAKIDCLSCANCCKNHSPRFKAPDINRISNYLKMKESEFVNIYLQMDEEGDYVGKKIPCTFLNLDNTCQIYDVRPSDCARYPYTNEDVFLKRKAITLKNSTVCPAVYAVLEKML